MAWSIFWGETEKGTGLVEVRFPVVIQRHDRETFQREGHFVPRMVDEHGRPRDWDGPLLFVGLLEFELKDAAGIVTHTETVLRVLADTPDELFRLMALRISETFFANFQAQRLQSTMGSDYKRVTEENVSLRERLGEAK